MYSTPGRENIQSLTGYVNFDQNINTLVDILTKREYLYLSYLTKKLVTTTLPVNLTTSPQNPLLIELKKTFNYIDPNSFSSEISREYFFSNINFIQFRVFKEFLINNIGGLDFFNGILCDYNFFNFLKTKNLGDNKVFLKNQYQPMKKGITNMIRLHATGAIALPIEIRLHILASSKDVIHS
jgi:hypothetical protein